MYVQGQWRKEGWQARTDYRVQARSPIHLTSCAWAAERCFNHCSPIMQFTSNRERGCRREMGMQHCARAARCRDGAAAAAGGFGDLPLSKNCSSSIGLGLGPWALGMDQVAPSCCVRTCVVYAGQARAQVTRPAEYVKGKHALRGRSLLAYVVTVHDAN